MTSFFNSMSLGVLIMTSDGRIMEANPTFVNMLRFQDGLSFTTIGEASDALVGVDFRRFIYSRDRQRFDTLLKQARRGASEGELVLLASDGRYIDVHLLLRFAGVGESDSVCIVMTDITLRKRNEEQIRRLNAELEARIIESNAAKQTALELAKLRSEFLANTSHETRAPLNTIIGLTELLLDTELSPEQRADLESIRGAANNLLTTLNNILDFSQISVRQLALQNTEFEPASVFEYVTDSVAILARRKGLELGLAIEQGVPTNAYGDPYGLRQVLTNLVSNAIKFTERGCVTVRVALDRATDLAVRLRCVVSDTGIGIAPNARKRLFRPFSQVDGSTTRRFGGTGLGLAIASQLVARMGGKIGAESKAGIGSSFWFTVQFRRAEQPRKMSEDRLLRDCRVLIVSPLDQIRRLLADQISSWGMHAILANSATESFAMLVNHVDNSPLHIVLAHLPGEEALKLTGLVQSKPKLIGARVIWIPTVNASHQVTPDSVHHVLPMPIKPTELLGVLISSRELAARREALSTLSDHFPA